MCLARISSANMNGSVGYWIGTNWLWVLILVSYCNFFPALFPNSSEPRLRPGFRTSCAELGIRFLCFVLLMHPICSLLVDGSFPAAKQVSAFCTKTTDPAKKYEGFSRFLFAGTCSVSLFSCEMLAVLKCYCPSNVVSCCVSFGSGLQQSGPELYAHK